MRVETTNWQARLSQAVGDAQWLLTRLHPLIVEPENSGPDTGTIGRHPPESREPWAMRAASAYWDLYFGAGELARQMRGTLGLRLPLFNDVHGAEALNVISNMTPSAPGWVLRSAAERLGRWVTAGKAIPDVDEGEQWTPIPSPPGKSPLACPYCQTYGLRMLKRKGEVRCFYPDCRDHDGAPTRARMEPGRMTGEERLIFGDGTTMGGEG